MGLLKALIETRVEKKNYYAGIERYPRYYMRPASDAYEVIDRQTGKVHGTYTQRGTAAQITNHLNGAPNA